MPSPVRHTVARSCRALAALGLAALCACAARSGSGPRKASLAAPPGELDLASIDASVAPGDDFFGYANGRWLKSAEIPPDQSSYGSAAIMAELTERRVPALIEEAAASAPAGSEARKIGDLYLSFLDEEAIEAKGQAPLSPELERIAAISDLPSLSREIGRTLRADVDVLNATAIHTARLFGLWIAQDLDEPSRYTVFILQGGLGMPDREDYLAQSAHMDELRRGYLAYITRLLTLSGFPEPAAQAARVLELEHKLALASAPRVDAEDVKKGNNHWARSEFEARAPGVDWTQLFGAAGLQAQPEFVVWQPQALIGISALVKSEPLPSWRAYLAARALDRAAPYLAKAYSEASFEFHGHILSGTPRQRERWKRAVSAVDAAMGEAVGHLYVERYFPASEKARAEEMVRNELAAFAQRIDRLEWMAPATKEKAKAKLRALKVGVGYPDRWRDYSGLEVVRGDAYGNHERAELFALKWNLAKLGKPVDRGEWVMNPQLVDAVNLPAMNALNFPAAILQPPDFDPARPAAMNYGAAGATIGHEISHSFDDSGALFDASGKLANWWTKEDFAHFEASSEALIKQYDAYHPFPDLAVNGRLTVDENIADVAGLSAAYDAWRMSLHGEEAPVVDGLTGDQQFFLAFAQSWVEKAREPALRQHLLTDGHAPPEYRADTVRNLDAWYAAFGVQPGQALYLAPDQRVRVW